MKNESLVRWLLATFALVFCTGLLAAGVVVADDDFDEDGEAKETPVAPYYQDQISEIQRRTEAAVIEVNEAAKAARQQAEAVKRQQYLDDFHEAPAGELLSKDELEMLEQQRKEREKTVRTKNEWVVEMLKDRGARSFEAWENSRIQAAQAPKQWPTQKSKTAIVTGIVFYRNQGAALLMDDVVRENEVIHGVKVLRITPGYVEFDKQGKKWRQEVGKKPPDAVWD